MSSIISSLSDLVKSLFEVVFSVFKTAGNAVEGALSFVLHLFTGAINLVLDFFRGLVDLTGGLLQFVFTNIAILGVLGAAFVGFLYYQRQQGNTVKVGNKKLN